MAQGAWDFTYVYINHFKAAGNPNNVLHALFDYEDFSDFPPKTNRRTIYIPRKLSTICFKTRLLQSHRRIL